MTQFARWPRKAFCLVLVSLGLLVTVLCVPAVAFWNATEYNLYGSRRTDPAIIGARAQFNATDRHSASVDAEGVALGFDFNYSSNFPAAFIAWEFTDLGNLGTFHPYLHIKWRPGENPAGWPEEYTYKYSQTYTGWHELKLAKNASGKINLYIDGNPFVYDVPWQYASTGYAFTFTFQERGSVTPSSVPQGDWLGHAALIDLKKNDGTWLVHQSSSCSWDGISHSYPRGVLSKAGIDPTNPYTSMSWIANYYDWYAYKP